MNMDIERTPRRGRRSRCGMQAEALEGRTLLFAAGDLDASFSQDGLADFVFPGGVTVTAYDVAVQGDGKTVLVGSSSAGGFAVGRLNLDGTPDPTFGPDSTGAVITPVGDFPDETYATAVTLQPDGEIVVAGNTKLDESLEFDDVYFGVVRYHPDGTLDGTFAGDGIRTVFEGGDAEDVVLQNDGKILVFGQAFLGGDIGANYDFVIARLNPNGTLDDSFDGDGVAVVAFGESDFGRAVALDSDGKIVMLGGSHSGSFSNFDRVVALARMNPDGSLDTSFGGDGRVTYRPTGRIVTDANDLLIQPGGKIVIAGHTTGLSTNDFLLARFNSDGTPDRTFGGDGTGAVLTDFSNRDDHATSVIPNFEGDRLLVAGSTNGVFAVARYTTNGVLDTSFQGDGKLITFFQTGVTPVYSPARILHSAPVPELARGPGRRFVAAGGPDFHAVRYLDDGANLVTIGSLDPNAAEAGQEPAHFIVGRPERLPTPLRVFLDVSGSARRPGQRPFQPDYLGEGITFGDGVITRTFVDIPAGATFASVIITPQDDALAEGDETAVFSIRPDPSYDVATPATTLIIADNDSAAVVGRRVFYNRSVYDGGDAAATAQDDAAIATDKQALLPGHTATFANVTSYRKGVNGVMIDVAGLANPSALSIDDFAFAIGGAAPPPPGVSVRRGAGVDGSDRITLVWTDGAIVNRWLKVTLKATARSGLASPDVFSFGNLAGETGDNPASLVVTAADLVRTRNAVGTLAGIGSRFDFDRDGVVGAADLVLVRNRVGGTLTAVRIPPPSLFGGERIFEEEEGEPLV